MLPRERVETAFRFEEVRPVPYTIWYDHETRERLTEAYGGTAWETRIDDGIRRMTVDWEPKNFTDANHYTDIHGTTWRAGEPAHVVKPALAEPSLQGFAIPSYLPSLESCRSHDPEDGHTILPLLSFADAARRCREEGGRRFMVIGYGFCIFEHAWMIRGYENFFSDLLLEPAFAHDLLDMITERHLELVGELVKLPCDGIIFSDDYGDQRGCITGPDLWRQFIKPRLKRLYAKVHESGRMTFQHTCGNVYDIVPDLIESGLDVLQSLQPEAMPVYDLKARYGSSLRLWGGLGTQRLLPYGTPDEIRAEIRRLKREMGAGGGYAFTSSKPIMKEVPLENAVAFLEETLAEEKGDAPCECPA